MWLPYEEPTPDQDEAQRWVSEELSRPEYGTELNPLTRFIRWLLKALSDGFFQGTWHPPISLVLLLVFFVFLIVLIVVIVINPIRVKKKHISSTVFGDEKLTIDEARAHLAAAENSQEWNEAYIWAFRLMVLTLAQDHHIHDGPGVTAREVALALTTATPQHSDALNHAAKLFDAVRYGDENAQNTDVTLLIQLTQNIYANIRASYTAQDGERP
ncbi:DUF4129 domain-containing protein [Schaalia sp. lx-260]|uniref:DUF4129 domain-containing protein n=1 Tax=Schaalia sp. lx-260 TaxID=2899082 RepID=UPI001E3DDBF6|nr:DUF4129 domain-containing protein [Schaalia sp. lx-260]MCD4549728.1 DUF4129 domain-containing protein [Schaalia sp. lx-260]